MNDLGHYETSKFRDKDEARGRTLPLFTISGQVRDYSLYGGIMLFGFFQHTAIFLPQCGHTNETLSSSTAYLQCTSES